MGYKKTNTTKRNKRGRTALFEKKRRQFNIYLNDEERLYITRQADRLDMETGVYIRSVAMGYNPVVPDREFRRQMMAVRDDIKSLFKMLDALHLTVQKRMAMLTDFGFLRRWVDGVKKELDFLDYWIKRL